MNLDDLENAYNDQLAHERRGEVGDLIIRLRYAAQGELFGDTLLEEAADRIEVLELEVDMWRTHVPDLEADLAKAKLSNKGMHKTIERLTDCIVELEKKIEYLCRDQENYEPILVAENQRLKATIKRVEDLFSEIETIEAAGDDIHTPWLVIRFEQALGEVK